MLLLSLSAEMTSQETAIVEALIKTAETLEGEPHGAEKDERKNY